MTISPLTSAFALCLAAACGDPGRGDVVADRAQRAAAGSRGIPAAELEAAAAEVIAFLRGAAPLDRVRLADTVVLYVSPEGGGGRAAFAREQLRHPSQWVVPSGRRRYALVPPPAATKLTTRVGRHVNCVEHPLSSRVPELAQLPHVGVRLDPDSAGSCLQSWNVTLVFAPDARPPRLVGAVYDQWEW